MGSALELEDRVRAVALDRERVRPVSDRQQLDREPASLGVAGEHAVQIARPQPGLVAARPGTVLADPVLDVVGLALDHGDADHLLWTSLPPRRYHEQRPTL